MGWRGRAAGRISSLGVRWVGCLCGLCGSLRAFGVCERGVGGAWWVWGSGGFVGCGVSREKGGFWGGMRGWGGVE